MSKTNLLNKKSPILLKKLFNNLSDISSDLSALNESPWRSGN